VVNALRPVLREGVRSVVLVSPARSSYAKDFIGHVRAHHAWLAQGSGKVAFSEVAGSADSLSKVAVLVKSAVFRQVVSETASSEAEVLVELLEKRLSAVGRDAFVFYSLVEIEGLVFGEWVAGKPKPEFLLLTDSYLAGCRVKGRLQRLMQVAANRGVKTRIVDGDSVAGKRVAQLGGMVLLAAVG
jgi:stalled ribosome rescue protein Dom34